MFKRTTRRSFLATSAAAAIALRSTGCATKGPFIKQSGRPIITSGVASGDITDDSAIIWSASDRAARMIVDWSTTESLSNATRIIGPDAVTKNGFTGKLDLQNLPRGQRIFYRVQFENLNDFSLSEPVVGSFNTAPIDAARDVTFAWSGDTAGQGWGIDVSRGGMPVYGAIADLRPDFFLHSGDNIYADIPIPPEVKLPDGTTWKNLVTQAKSAPAQTVDDFRGNYAYNMLDANVKRMQATVPLMVQWDDHEVRNNWQPGQILTDKLYDEKDVNTLAARARQAFMDYMPIRRLRQDPDRIYRAYAHGPLLEVFMLDQRSYRAMNTNNRQKTMDGAATFLGPAQLQWIKDALRKSKATWKVIASDMPLSCISKDGDNYEAWANGDKGAPLGRELELASLLSFIKTNNIRNTLWITADVHFAANIQYHPDRAAFKEFDPFWEFISGPLHAGGFGPSALDATFGPQYQWKRTPEKSGNGPGHGFAHFGVISIDAKTKTMRVAQRGIDGKELSHVEIAPLMA